MKCASSMNAGRRFALLGTLVLSQAGLLAGCATSQNRDPLEAWNRKVFSFNDTLDETVIQPVARGYNWVTPEPVRIGVRNVFNNVGDVWSTVNLFLQGRMADGTLGVIRVTINSTFGLAGLLDVATPMQLERKTEDFGQTLGVWGVKPGAYIVWPLLGPSTLRDSFGIPGDYYVSASSLASYPREGNLLTALNLVSLRANLLDATTLLDDIALDKYAFYRDAYLQRRQNLIYEGNPPEDDEPTPDSGNPSVDEAAPLAPPSAASAASAAAVAPAASAASAP
jgi:phospholipid-binding lipoprotein MlaA